MQPSCQDNSCKPGTHRPVLEGRPLPRTHPVCPLNPHPGAARLDPPSLSLLRDLRVRARLGGHVPGYTGVGVPFQTGPLQVNDGIERGAGDIRVLSVEEPASPASVCLGAVGGALMRF